MSALAYSLAATHADPAQPELQPPYNDLTRFILEQHGRMADYLRAPLLTATLGFDLLGLLRTGSRFHHWRTAGARAADRGVEKFRQRVSSGT